MASSGKVASSAPGMEDESLNTATLSQDLVASISRILIQSKTPCILWGNYLLTIYGVPSIVEVSELLPRLYANLS